MSFQVFILEVIKLWGWLCNESGPKAGGVLSIFSSDRSLLGAVQSSVGESDSSSEYFIINLKAGLKLYRQMREISGDVDICELKLISWTDKLL